MITMEISYDVRVWQIETRQGQRRDSYGVHWSVAGRRRGGTFQTYALADGFRAELLTATHRGDPFDVLTGLPATHGPRASMVGWYDFALQFVDCQWPRVSANHRRNTARTLMIVTTALLTRDPPGVGQRRVRVALQQWAFNTGRRDSAPDDVVAVLGWVRRHTPTMEVWNDPAAVEDVLLVLGTLLDGTPAAASSVQRHRRVLNLVMRYAVRRRVLLENPLPRGRGGQSKRSIAVDRRCLLNPRQAAGLLDRVRRRPRGGARLNAFFTTLYYAGMRPEEAVALRVRDLVLPQAEEGDQWGEVTVHGAEPEVGRQWTQTGTAHEQRGLKGRDERETRCVPCHPALTRLLRDYVAAQALRPEDRLFAGERGGVLAGSVYRRAWRQARQEVLPPHVCASPTGKRIYDLRHTCLTTWLNSGVPPAQVAEWAGTSVAMLFSVYAHCISGQTKELQRRIEAAWDIASPDAAA
ncbi:tyrosine-type recombinase/integrase [Streptomyces sp. NPDC056039]|uniref:tyrosine-type recombinase/integrase n=1 Tax=Streptomyces sp. NPDC056039 TaxID=3345687 RepID=UPI0035DB4A3C